MEPERFDVIVVGAGPAGIQCGYELQHAGLKYVILEKSAECASFFSTFPRMRELISINKVHCGDMDDDENVLRYDWNSLLVYPSDKGTVKMRDITKAYYPSAGDLKEYLKGFVSTHDIRIHYNTHVTDIIKDGSGFRVSTQDGVSYSCGKIIMATGLVPKRVDLPNKTLWKCAKQPDIFFYDQVPVDVPETFANKTVLMVGTGNSTWEIANHLLPYVKQLVVTGTCRMAWRTHYPGHLRSKNMAPLDAYYLKQNAVILWKPEYIDQRDILTDIHHYLLGTKPDLMVLPEGADAIVFCVGFGMSMATREWCAELGVTMGSHGFPVLTSACESVSCPGIYFAGALTQEHDYKHGTSAFIHGFRYNARHMVKSLVNKHDVRMWDMPQETSLLANHIACRLTQSSCLFHRFDAFYDVLIPEVAGGWVYRQDVHVPTFQQSHLKEICQEPETSPIMPSLMILIGLGYNPHQPFNEGFVQKAEMLPRDAHKGKFIHPMLRILVWEPSKKEWAMVHTCHLVENVFNQFDSELYKYCLGAFLDLVKKMFYYVGGRHEWGAFIQEWYRTIEEIE